MWINYSHHDIEDALSYIRHFSKGIFDDKVLTPVIELPKSIRTQAMTKFNVQTCEPRVDDLISISDLVFRRTSTVDSKLEYVVCYWKQNLFIFVNGKWSVADKG